MIIEKCSYLSDVNEVSVYFGERKRGKNDII
jgi:hypothetical protein